MGSSLKYNLLLWHFEVIFRLNFQGNWRFEGESRGTIPELIAVQHDSNQPVTNKSQAILKTAIVKETWELNNDDIETCEKIGNVRKCLQTFLRQKRAPKQNKTKKRQGSLRRRILISGSFTLPDIETDSDKMCIEPMEIWISLSVGQV